ncbi:MAG: hypothetical protein ABI333_03865 [bacterium]
MLTNLGAKVLVAYQYVQQAGAPTVLAAAACSPTDFLAARARIASQEEPAIRQRSMVRNLPRHLDRLRGAWFGT